MRVAWIFPSATKTRSTARGATPKGFPHESPGLGVAARLKITDAVWLLLMALQHYETLYERIPDRIADAARDDEGGARDRGTQAKAAQEEAQKTLANAIHLSAVALHEPLRL
jgi:hypothetical protein